MLEQDVTELLEQEERKAAEKNAAKTAHKNTDDSTRDPRRQGRERKDRDTQNRYSAEREENDERRSRRSKGAADADDEDMPDATSDRGSANGSVRSRRRSRSPHGARRSSDDHSYRERSRVDRRRLPDRRLDDHQRDYIPLDNGVDSYRPGGDSRRSDRPPSRGNRDRRDGDDRPPSRGGYRDRLPDRRPGDHPDRNGDRRVSGRDGRDGRDRRRSPPGGGRRRTPEPTDDERDRRTVFVQQLAARLRTKELQAFFESVGPVVEAQIVKDRVSGRSKGVGYVEFKEEESVKKAIELTGQKLLGIPIIAQLTEAEKNRQARHTEGAATQSNGVPFHRLYVGNIHFSITEDDLKNVFEPFGELEFVQLQKEEQGRSKGYGFVQFINPDQAKEALEKMNGFELAGRPIRVGLGNDKFTHESTQSLLQRFGSQAQQAQFSDRFQGSSFSGMGGRGAHAGGTGNFDRASGRDGDKGLGGASALDDTDVGAVNFSNYSRDALMRKLARTEEPVVKDENVVKAKKETVPVDHVKPTRCILLKNMYNQAEETGPDWQKELEEDVKIECEDKYGHVVHIGVALDSPDGEIYIKFDRVQGGENAIRGLNGRYFGGRMITAQYVVDAVYHMNFPKAANV